MLKYLIFFIFYFYSVNAFANVGIVPALVNIDRGDTFDENFTISVKKPLIVTGFLAIRNQDEYGDISYDEVAEKDFKKYISMDYQALKTGIHVKDKTVFKITIKAGVIRKNRDLVNKLFFVIKEKKENKFMAMQMAVPLYSTKSIFKGNVKVEFVESESFDKNNFYKYKVKNESFKLSDINFLAKHKNSKFDLFKKNKKGVLYPVKNNKFTILNNEELYFYLKVPEKIKREDLILKISDVNNKNKIFIK